MYSKQTLISWSWQDVTCLRLYMICDTQVVQSGGKNIELAVIRRNQPLKVKLLIYDFCIFIFLQLSWHSILVILLMLEHSFHLSSFTDSGVQRNRDAGRRNRKRERGGGREEEAEEVFVNHSHDCVAPLSFVYTGRHTWLRPTLYPPPLIH